MDRSPEKSNGTVSRISRYPDAKHNFRREIQAPVKHLKFGLSISNSNHCRGDLLSEKLCNARKQAFDALRYFKKEKEVIILEEDNEEKLKELVSSDYGVEEVEVIEKGENNVEGKGRRFQPSSSGVTGLNNSSSKKANALDNLSNEREAYRKLLNSSERTNKLKGLGFEIELNESESLIAELKALRLEKNQEEQEEVMPSEPFVPLRKEEMAEVSHAFSARNMKRILVSHENSSIDIRGEVLQCLKPGSWLNDEVINLYLELLKERENREPKKFLKCHFFNTFFYKKLVSRESGYNYKAVKRWTSQRKLGYCLFDCDKIFVPIHKDIHWCLAVINKKDQKFQYLDSLRGGDAKVLNALANYYVEEVMDKSGKDIDIISWEKEYVEDLPTQKNGFDCGMFMLKYIDFYSRGLSLCFDQEHMRYFRARTAKEILRLRAD
ncbi:EARLY IN SHORT DAYS 4 [Hibiscus trionum]|nr:EARLY IN SHORT DAYS 4 [Hibiscus trionum]